MKTITHYEKIYFKHNQTLLAELAYYYVLQLN